MNELMEFLRGCKLVEWWNTVETPTGIAQLVIVKLKGGTEHQGKFYSEIYNQLDKIAGIDYKQIKFCGYIVIGFE